MAKVQVRLSKSHEHLVFTQTEFNDMGIGVDTKTGALPISPDFDPEEVLAAAQELEWELYGEPNEAGYYKARQVTADIEQKRA